MDKYSINFKNTQYILELYQNLYNALELDIDFVPGNNTDALFDILTGFIDGPAHFDFYNVKTMPDNLQTFFYDDIIRIFKRAEAWYFKFNEEFSYTIVD